MGDRCGGLVPAVLLLIGTLAITGVEASRHLFSASRDLQQTGGDCCDTVTLDGSGLDGLVCSNGIIELTTNVVDGDSRPLSLKVMGKSGWPYLTAPLPRQFNNSTCDPRVSSINWDSFNGYQQDISGYYHKVMSVTLTSSNQPTKKCTPSSCDAAFGTPEPIGPPNRLFSLSVSLGFAGDASGNVWTWGANLYGEQGIPGGTKWTPTYAPWLKGALAISSSRYHTCAVLPPNNVIKCTGYNNYGQIGTGSRTPGAYSEPITLDLQAITVAAGYYHTCAILLDQSVSCWGMVEYGALGIGVYGSAGEIRAPIPVVGLPVGSQAVSIAAGGGHTCVVLTDGTSWCWGNNDFGKLGLNDTNSRAAPTQVTALGDNVKAVKAGSMYTYWILKNNTVRCAGYSSTGALGIGNPGTQNEELLPVAPIGIGQVLDVSVSVGGSYACVLVSGTTGNEVRCTGNNYYGSVGGPVPGIVYTFQTVPGTGDATAVMAGAYTTCAVFSDVAVPIKCWGWGVDGRLGIGKVLVSANPPTDVYTKPTPQVFPRGSLVVTGSSGSCPLQLSLRINRICPATITCPATVQVECGASTTVDINPSTFLNSCTVSPTGATLTLATTSLPCKGGPYYVGVTVSAPNYQTTGNSIIVNTKDVIPPAVLLPSSSDPAVVIQGNTVTVEASSASGTLVSVLPVATDAVDGAVTVTCGNNYPGVLPVGSNTVSCTARDNAGNLKQYSFTVKVQDTVAPIFSPNTKGDVSGVANRRESNVAGVWFPASADSPLAVHAYDFGVEIYTVQCTSGAGTVIDLTQNVFMPAGETTITCVATDAAGNKASLSYKVIVTDDPPSPPQITATEWPLQANNTNGWVSVDGSKSFTPPIFRDTVDGDITATCDVGPTDPLPMGSTAVTCTATDGGGHMSSPISFTIIVKDDVPLLLSNLADSTVESTVTGGAKVPLSPVAVDGVKGDVSDSVVCTMLGLGGTEVPVCTRSSCDPTLFPLGATQVTCRVSSYRTGVSTVKSISVKVVDTTKPQVVLSGAPTVYEATGPDGYWLDPTTLVKATDAPADNLLLSGVSCTKPAGQFAVGVTSVTCTAEDTSGNKGSLTVDVTVQDTTAPTITVTAPGSREATKPSGADVTWDDPTVSDIVTPADQLDVVCAPPSGSVFAVGEIPVTCTVTDKAGNNATTSFKVTVVDTTPPQLTGVSLNIKVYTGASSEKVTWELPTATDAVTVKPPVQCKPPSGSAFQVDKTTVVTCTARDEANNTASATFEVTVVDGQDPTIQVPPSTTLEAQGPAGADWTGTRSPTFGAVFTDRGADLSGTCYGLSGGCSTTSCKFPLGVTKITCNATDASNRTASSTFSVTVRDTTPPVVGLVAPSPTEATSPQGAKVTFTVTATDLVDGTVVPVVTPLASGSTFPIGLTKVSINATDAAGNTAPLGVLQVLVQDTTPPAVTIAEPRDITVESLGIDGERVTWPASKIQAVDVADPSPTVNCTPASGSTFRPGSTSVTCIASDKYSNVSPGVSFTVYVKTPIDLITDLLDKFTKKPIQGRVIAALLDALKTMGGKPRKQGDKELLCKLIGGVTTAIKGDSSSTGIMSKVGSTFKC